MDKEVTTAELARLAKKGVVKFDPEDTNIARFGELLDKLTQLLEQKASDTQADLARSQVQLEVLATLQKTMSKRSQGGTKSQQIDLSPLREILDQLKEMSAKCSYQFDIQRDPHSSYMTGVTATPIPPTKRIENKTEPPTAYIDSVFVRVGCVSCKAISPAVAKVPARPAS